MKCYLVGIIPERPTKNIPKIFYNYKLLVIFTEQTKSSITDMIISAICVLKSLMRTCRIYLGHVSELVFALII